MGKTALIDGRDIKQMQTLGIDNHHIASIPTEVESRNRKRRRGINSERQFSINGTMVDFPQSESLLLATIRQHSVVCVECRSKTSSRDKQQFTIARLPEPCAAVP